MNLIRLSKDWAVLVRLAHEKKLTSKQPRPIQQFIDDTIQGDHDKRATIFAELIQFLREEEIAAGKGTIVVPFGDKA